MIGDMSRAKSTGTLTEEEEDDRRRFLWEKQAYEAARLENDLHNAEVKAMNETVMEVEEEKDKACKHLAEELKHKLDKVRSQIMSFSSESRKTFKKSKIIFLHYFFSIIKTNIIIIYLFNRPR